MAAKVSDLASANLQNLELTSDKKKSWLKVFADNYKAKCLCHFSLCWKNMHIITVFREMTSFQQDISRRYSGFSIHSANVTNH